MANNKATVNINLNSPKIIGKVTNDKLGLFMANEWYRLITPYTPRRDGFLMDNVVITPFKIKYLQPYSHRLYHSEGFNFRQDMNPYATDHWDKKADQAGQKLKLIQSINSYQRSVNNG